MASYKSPLKTGVGWKTYGNTGEVSDGYEEKMEPFNPPSKVIFNFCFLGRTASPERSSLCSVLVRKHNL